MPASPSETSCSPLTAEQATGPRSLKRDMPQDSPPPGPITLLHVLPLYYVAVMWGVANALAARAGGGWRRHFLATLVSSAVGVAGVVATFRLGLWLERRSGLAPERQWKRAVIVFSAGLAATLVLTSIATQDAKKPLFSGDSRGP